VSESDPVVHEAAEAVADGIPVDWDRAASRLESRPQRALLENLRDIRGFAMPVRHATKASAASAGTSTSVFVSLVAAIATIQIAVGVIGFVSGPADGSEIPALWQLLLLSVFAAAGFGLAIGGRGDSRAVLLGTFYLVAGTSFAQRFIGRLAGSPQPLWASLYLEALAPYLLWRFVQAFPRVERFSRIDRLASSAVPLTLLIGGVLVAANLGQSLAAENGLFWLFEPFGRRRSPGNFYWAVISVLTLAALVVAPFRARSAATPERRRVAWFLLGIGVGAAPLLTDIVLEIFVPSVASILSPGMLAAMVYPFLASIPVTTAYAVIVDRVVEVSFVIRRTLQYALARAAILGLTIAPLVLLLQIAFTHRDRTIRQLLELPAGRLLVASALTGVVLMLARERLLSGIDRAFRRNAPTPDKAVALVTGEIRDATDVRELSARAEPILTEMLRSSRPAILTLNPASTAFESLERGWHPLPTASALVALLGDDEDAIDLGRDRKGGLFAMLPTADKEWLEETSCAVLAPLRGRTGDLLGILALRVKDGGLRFTSADLVAIRGVAGPVALVLDQILERRHEAGGTDDEESAAAECIACGAVNAGAARTCECGGHLRTAAIPRLVAGKFRVERRLGAGAMGTAYVASDVALQRTVVIKALPRRVAGAARQLEGEARAMARVSDSRLALIFGVETWRGAPLLVMEYLAGGTLAERIRKGPLAPAGVLAIGSVLARGLQVLHENGLLHRDVKPTNIGFTAEGSPKLLDFGLASLIGDVEDPSRLAGTPIYLAPELLSGIAAGPTSDLWSLSLALYESIAGRHPFASRTVDGALRSVVSATVPDLVTMSPEVPPLVDDLFRMLLAPDPSHRPRSAAEMVERLELVLSQVNSSS
jgi:tRNA A-37 threonylcarbamoyl transferase component Bud32